MAKKGGKTKMAAHEKTRARQTGTPIKKLRAEQKIKLGLMIRL
jgi:hypothetical protein